MKKLLAIVAVTAVLVLTGCGESATDDAKAEPRSFAATGETDTEETPAETVEEDPTPEGITNPGEVCDPQNLNDSICAAFYPEQLVLNVLSEARAGDEIGAMSDEEKITLAQSVCDGNTNPFGDASKDVSARTAGGLAYCPEVLTEDETWRVAAYREMGEEAAKASFANNEVIQR